MHSLTFVTMSSRTVVVVVDVDDVDDVTSFSALDVVEIQSLLSSCRLEPAFTSTSLLLSAPDVAERKLVLSALDVL